MTTDTSAIDTEHFTKEARLVLAQATRFDGPVCNKANTEGCLMRPILAALGWNVRHAGAVYYGYRLDDGTVFDHAFFLGNTPAMFCEARPFTKRPGNRRWVSQKINWADNESVAWCVVSDGLQWRVFEANSAAPMRRKLAFKVHLRDVLDPDKSEEALRLFERLTPASVAGQRTATAAG